MDPQTISTTLSTLVGLISIFKQERSAEESCSWENFRTYLDLHHFAELKSQIEGTANLLSEVERLLHKDQKEIIEKLNTINAQLGTVLSRIDGFGELAKIFAPTHVISAQCYEWLKAFYDSESEALRGFPTAGNQLVLQFAPRPGQCWPVQYRFLRDDLETLCGLNLLSRDEGEQGGEISFYATRQGAKYMEIASLPGART